MMRYNGTMIPKSVIKRLIDSWAHELLRTQNKFTWGVWFTPERKVTGEIMVSKGPGFISGKPEFEIDISEAVISHMRKAYGIKVWAIENWVKVRIGHVIGHCIRASELLETYGEESYQEYMKNEFTANDVMESFSQLQWLHLNTPEAVADKAAGLTMKDYAVYYLNWVCPGCDDHAAIDIIQKEPKLAEELSVDEYLAMNNIEEINKGRETIARVQNKI